MLDLKLSRIGTLTMAEGDIRAKGFKAEGAMCRETAALALLWAIGELQRELQALIEQPGGTGNVSMD